MMAADEYRVGQTVWYYSAYGVWARGVIVGVSRRWVLVQNRSVAYRRRYSKIRPRDERPDNKPSTPPPGPGSASAIATVVTRKMV